MSKALNPLELYKLAADLEQKVLRLEAEKIELLENRTIELERQVEERTEKLKTKVEAQLQDFLDNANELIQSVALEDGHFEFVNRAWREILGYTEAEISQLNFFDILHPDNIPHCRQLITQMQAAPFSFLEPIELKFLTKTKEVVLVEGSLNCRLENGQPVATRAIFRDIRERKRLEEQLANSESKIRGIFEAMTDIILTINLQDNDLDNIDIAPVSHHLATVHHRSVVSETVRTFFQESRGSEWLSRIRQVITSGKTEQFDYSLTVAGGEVWFAVNISPFAKNSVIWVARDITDRKLAEQTIRQQAERESLLREITQRIRQSFDIQTIFETAAQEIRQFLHADQVGIFKFYPDSNFDDGELVAESAVEGFTLVISHWSLVISHFNQGQLTNDNNLIVPLLNEEDLWGLLCIHQSSAPRSWQPVEINFVQQIANQIAIAIQQANLYEQVHSELIIRKQAEAAIAFQLRQQQTLGEIVQKIRESLNINEILATVTQQVKELMQVERAIVFRLFPNGKSQIVEEIVSPEYPNLKNRNWEDEEFSGEIYDSYLQGRSRIVPDVMTDAWAECLQEYMVEAQIQSKIVAPILQESGESDKGRWVNPNGNNQLWGLLIVHSCGYKRIWEDSEALLLQQIANQLAIAIQQASLFEQIQKELAERQQAEARLTESNQQLAISNEELARATRLKNEFLANMSHELRTPLNAILGMSSGLQESVFGLINERQQKAITTIEHSGQHLLELINDILDLSKIEAGKLELDLSDVPVENLCQSSLAFIKQLAFNKRISLSIQIPHSLKKMNIRVDDRCLRQVLINLLNNAVKFTPVGGSITLAVRIEMPQAIAFSVTDTGIGIAPENLNKLFQSFVQIDSRINRQYAGTGLGLALVKRIVELHGGTVSVESEINRGSCFTVRLPLSEVPEIHSPEPLPPLDHNQKVMEKEDSAPVVAPTQTLILLAEDNLANVETFSGYLESRGYRLVVAENGQQAIDQARMHLPDIILMDIQMPEMDGLEATRRIREQPELAQIPIIALTALAMLGDREKCLNAGANEYLTKPVRLKELATIIQTLLAAN